MSKENYKDYYKALLYSFVVMFGAPVFALQYIVLLFFSESYLRYLIFVLLVGIILILLFEMIFLISTFKPIKYDQLMKLSSNYSKRYLQKNYVFSKKHINQDSNICTFIRPTSDWYPCNIKASEFPEYICSLRRCIRLDWTVIGIESGGYVKSFWISRGMNPTKHESVCSLDEIASKCCECGCYTVMRLRNCQDYEYRIQSSFVVGDKDYANTLFCSNYFSTKGINWLDILCSSNDFCCFFRNLSPYCQIPGNGVSDYVDILGISSLTDLVIRRKYIRTTKIYKYAKRIFFLSLASILYVSWFACFTYEAKKIKWPQKQAKIEDPIEKTIESSFEPAVEETTKNDPIVITINNVSADSEYKSKSGKEYSAKQMIDNDFETCWQEGSDGDGIGEEILFEFDKTTVYKIGIVNGNRTYDGAFYKNSRLSEITVDLYSNGIKISEMTMMFEDDESIEITECILDKPLKCDQIVITIESVYKGSSYSDTGVTEVIIYGDDK